MEREEIENIKTLYQRNRPDLIIDKVEYRIERVKKIMGLIREAEKIEEELGYLGLCVGAEESLLKAANRFKRMYITMVLRKMNWNKTETAKILKIERTYLSKLIGSLKVKDKKKRGKK